MKIIRYCIDTGEHMSLGEQIEIKKMILQALELKID